MRKTILIATTALVLCLSTAIAGQPSDRPGGRMPLWKDKFGRVVNGNHDGGPVTVAIAKANRRPMSSGAPAETGHVIFSNLSKDPNAEFIDWYGFAVSSQSSCSYFSQSDFLCLKSLKTDAVAFVGNGATARKLGVAAAPGMHAGIYKATASGLPGKELAGGTLSGTGAITWVDIDLKLESGTRYFIEVRCPSSPCESAWGLEDSDFSGKTVDYYHAKFRETYNFGSGTYTHSSSLPWHSSTYYPTAGAAIIK